jgi:hypothetical protein
MWTLSNGRIRVVFQLTPEGHFLTQQIADMESGDVWKASPNRPASPVRLQADAEVFDAQRQFLLRAQYAESVNPGGVRQFIVLQDLKGAARITVVFELYNNQPVLRYNLRYQNLAPAPAHVT